MEEMMQVLKNIGLPEDERKRIREYYRDDLDGLTRYVIYMKAILDDRHEYV